LRYLLTYYSNLLQKVIGFIESSKYSKFIPFKGMLLWYLRLPFPVKLFFNIAGGFFAVFLVYNIGFIVLQSRAKNEVLSLISAHTNPVSLPTQLVFYHAFIFFLLFIGSVLPILMLYGFVQFFHIIKKENNYSKNKTRWLATVTTIFAVFASLAMFVGAKHVLPWVIYFLLFRSDAPGYYEQFRKHFETSAPLRVAEYVDLEKLTKELSVAFIEPTTLTALLAFFLYLSIKYLRPFFRIIISSILSFVLLLFVFLHSTTQLGALGRNLAQFDNDIVYLSYSDPAKGVCSEVIGIRVAQWGNSIVIRTEESTYTIISDKMMVKSLTIEEYKTAKEQNSCRHLPNEFPGP